MFFTLFLMLKIQNGTKIHIKPLINRSTPKNTTRKIPTTPNPVKNENTNYSFLF